MDKLNPAQLNQSLKDVRTAYRLLALYQKRVIDTIHYIGNAYQLVFASGWAKFSNAALNGHRAKIHNKWAWDWLTMYMYEFNMGQIDINGDTYYYKIVHQADTGYFDASHDAKIAKPNAHEFADVNSAETRLIFVLSKNTNGCPIKNHLNGHLTAEANQEVHTGNWVSVPYSIERFVNQASTDAVLEEFNDVCLQVFGVSLRD